MPDQDQFRNWQHQQEQDRLDRALQDQMERNRLEQERRDLDRRDFR
jgi:hypothetical protein